MNQRAFRPGGHRRRSPVGLAWPGTVGLLLVLLFLILALGAPLWGAPLMVGLTMLYVAGWTRWRSARQMARLKRQWIEPRSGQPALLLLGDRRWSTRQVARLKRKWVEAQSGWPTLLLSDDRHLAQRDQATVISGDTLAVFADAWGCTVAELAAYNHITHPNDLRQGLELRRPPVELMRSTTAVCECPSGHLDLHHIVAHVGARVLRECETCDPPRQWIELNGEKA